MPRSSFPAAKPSALSPTTRPTPSAPDLREACVQAARDVIAEVGVEALSLRDVARRLGVSHQAPYRHYPSREHLLAEVMRRCFEQFAAHLDTRDQPEAPMDELRSLGERYLTYAQAHPLEYRLMFGTPWPGPAEHPHLIRAATHAFDALRGVLKRVHGAGAAQRLAVEADAMFIWSTMHGLAGVLSSSLMPHLGLHANSRKQAAQQVLNRVGATLAAPRG